MSDSDSSALSSAPPTDDEKLAPIFLKAKGKKTAKATKANKPTKPPAIPISPPRRKRTPSPSHEGSLADNSNIAFIVMFRSRFSAAFPPKLAHYGPQDIERGVEDAIPSPQVENLLCAFLGIVLNRKKPVERGHHGRALEEAIASQKAQWPRSWNGHNPLAGSRNFHTMSAVERLDLLATLALWSLSSSEIVSQTIKDSYKQSRHEDDLNQPLSVQPWGADSDKRRYWLIEGQDDTSFRLYRESNRADKDITWWNVAGTIDEIKAVATKLEKDDSQAARRLSTRITSAIPRFEATDEKRKRREYRQVRRAQFTRPEPGFSMYEGRTRGKRMRYTFDDEFDEDEDAPRRSTRNSDRSTPAEGPTVTASGRTVRPRGGGTYGETLLSGQSTDANTPLTNDYADSEDVDHAHGTRASGRLGGVNGNRKRKHIDGHSELDEVSDEEDVTSSLGWSSPSDSEEIIDLNDEMEEDGDDVLEDDDEDLRPDSLVVKLKVPRLGEIKGGGGINTEPTHTTTGNESSGVAKPPTNDAEHAHLNGVKEESDTINVKMAPSEPNNHLIIPTQEPVALPLPDTESASYNDKLAGPTSAKSLAAQNTPIVPSALSEVDAKPGQPNGSAAVAGLPQSTGPLANGSDVDQHLLNGTDVVAGQ